MRAGPSFPTVILALVSHWRRKPAQLVAMLAGLAAATALWSGVQAVNAEARAAYAAAEAALAAQPDMLAGTDGGPIAQEVYIALRRAGWAVSPVLEGDVRIGGRSVRVLGLDPASMARGEGEGGFGALGGADPADFMTPPWRALVAPQTLRDLGIAAGEAPALEGGGTLPPVAAAPGVEPGAVLMDIGAAQAVLGMRGMLTGMIVTGARDMDAPPLEAVAGGALRRIAAEGAGDPGMLTASFHLNLTAFALLAFVVGLFIAHAAAGLGFEQRRGQMRTMRACGVSARALAGALLAETLVLALLAGIVGLALGYAIAGALLPGVSATLQGLYGAPAPGGLVLRPAWIASGLLMSLAGALAALGAGLVKSWRMPVLAPAQPMAWRAAQAVQLRRQAVAAGLLLAASGALLGFGSGLVAGFAGLAALLLGAALLLPPALAALLDLAARAGRAARSPVAEWFWADARRDMSGIGLALMALLLALSANIGVGGMVGGFRHSFTDWLDQRLAADLYVNPVDAARGEDIAAWLAAREDVRAVLPVREAQAGIGGWPVEVVGFTDDTLYRDTWPLLDGALGNADWDTVARGEAALISEQTARRLGLGRGQVLALPTPSGEWAVRVAGAYPDYGNPRGQVRVNIAALGAHFPDASPPRYEVRVSPGAAPGIMAGLRGAFGPGAAVMMEQAGVKALSLQIFERTFVVTGALSVLTLIVAGGALLAGLAALAGQRIVQLAPVWAMGVRRGALSLLELGKILALAMLTSVLAIPLGIVLTWVLVAIINVEAFGWRLPLHVFPADWLRLIALALLAATLAALGPALLLARTRPAQLAKVFAHEG